MPKFVAPRNSGPHRIAAIALYRALLSQCKPQNIAHELQQPCRNVIRKRFRDNANLSSTRLLRDAFTAGHEALNHLHRSAGGNAESTSYLAQLLDRLPPKLKAPLLPRPPIVKKDPTMASGFENTGLAARPRPLSDLKGGRRLVPILVSANRIPILRFTRPQPAALSTYLHAKMVQRQKRHDRRWALMDAARLAKWEDSWDRTIDSALVVQGLTGSDVSIRAAMTGRVTEPTWEKEVQIALAEVCQALDRESRKNAIWAAKMVGIVRQEKALAEQERKERVMLKNSARRERKNSQR